MNDSTLLNIADLALHPNTPEPEWHAAAIAFFRVLRNNGALSVPNPATRHPSAKAAPSSYAMPFGRYAGTALHQVPADYLAWLVSNPWLRDPLRAHINQELAARGL